MQEIHTKLLISRLSLVQNIFYHYIHGMKHLIIPIICMLLSLAGCHERKPLPSLDLADSLLTDAGDKSGALRIFLQIEEQLQSRQDPYNKGLLYERIGSIYYGQMNYVRAYHYFKQARENLFSARFYIEGSKVAEGCSGKTLVCLLVGKVEGGGI